MDDHDWVTSEPYDARLQQSVERTIRFFEPGEHPECLGRCVAGGRLAGATSPCLKDRINDFEAWGAEGTIWNISSVHVISVTRV